MQKLKAIWDRVGVRHYPSLIRLLDEVDVEYLTRKIFRCIPIAVCLGLTELPNKQGATQESAIKQLLEGVGSDVTQILSVVGDSENVNLNVAKRLQQTHTGDAMHVLHNSTNDIFSEYVNHLSQVFCLFC